MNFGAEKFDILLLAGQSNAEGSGCGPINDAYVPDERIYQMNAPLVIEHGNWVVEYPLQITIDKPDLQKRCNLAIRFAQEYVNAGMLKEGRKLLIIHAAMGGTCFYNNGHWTPSGICCRRMMYMLGCALEMNSENRLVALLWHQGESDIIPNNDPLVYHDQLKRCFEMIKERSKLDYLPIIAGDLVPDWKEMSEYDCDPIVEQIKRVTDEMGGAFADSTGLESNQGGGYRDGDMIHFTKNALNIFGNRYFEEYKKIRR